MLQRDIIMCNVRLFLTKLNKKLKPFGGIARLKFEGRLHADWSGNADSAGHPAVDLLGLAGLARNWRC
jgi:allantoicase